MSQINLKRSLTSMLFVVAILTCLSVSAKGIPVQTVDGEVSDFGAELADDKWTVVMIWTTYCGTCKVQYPKIAAFNEAHQDNDAVVLGISLDGFGSGELVREYQEKYQHNFRSVIANADEFAEPYEKTTNTKFSGTPTYLIFDPQKRLQAYKNGVLEIAEIESFIAQ